ncbi:hypothetical protein VMCG_05445 [Cytospora schulzeri]|uniref:F-box domain-containing protein n=1 Tax=Cytospora schulzeri TaxID=448051 RepID=A0A423WKP3_9PEZI|nr:hypothetical protein VMCG_05445 [Valsa malicola]
MDEPPPSYNETIRQKDWLEVVVPYIDTHDYAKLCRISQRFYAVFAIRLWKDPLPILRKLRCNTSTEHQWYSYFINHMRRGVRVSTASMVAVLDFRGATMSCGLAPSTLNSDLVREIPARFPNVRCLLLDGHSGLDPSMLSRNSVLSRHPQSSLGKLHLLSLADCGLPLPARFAVDRWLIGLVYLDLSNTPGSLQSLIDQNSLKVENLPQLRILKIRRKSLDYATASALIHEFRNQLWSLDVSGNNLGDKFLEDLIHLSFPTYSSLNLQTAGHFEVEGKIRSTRDNSGYFNGRFYFIEESAFSETFSSPERYLADTPVYHPENIHSTDNEGPLTLHTRSNGRGRPRGDSVTDALRVLAGNPGEATPDAPHLRYSPHWPPPHVGTTHLHLNDLAVSASAVKRLLHYSPGHLEHFECDSAICLSTQRSSALVNKAPWLSKSTSVLGLPGSAYLFRPVISSNLRVLKIHHSLVTNTPTVACRSTNVLTKQWLAETCLRERMDLAYPQTYVPDMNPRLYSLTLCMIPRYSTGAVTQRLINFLKLAARQEQMIEKAKASTPPRGPPILQGLRHIRLEFEPDAGDEIASLQNEADDLDPGALLSRGEETFSFFSESAWAPSSSPVNSKTEEQPHAVSTATNPPESSEPQNETETPVPQKLDCAPFNQADGEHIDITIKPTNDLDKEVTVPGIIRPPGRTVLRGMRDVLGDIKAFRLGARRKYVKMEAGRGQTGGDLGVEEHEHWKGRLVVVLSQGSAQSSNYWR